MPTKAVYKPSTPSKQKPRKPHKNGIKLMKSLQLTIGPLCKVRYEKCIPIGPVYMTAFGPFSQEELGRSPRLERLGHATSD